ncbi:MAG TPA: dienelactone hydrolase family protein [Patescibacteria group bacterium]|nr:dienelactone hydrolase family protein [Patescibacteria group bacterium]
MEHLQTESLKSLSISLVFWAILSPQFRTTAAETDPGFRIISGTEVSAVSSLPGTQPLVEQGDIASNLVAGVDRFLLRELNGSQAGRARYWHRDFSSPDAYTKSVATNRARLAHILGVRDTRVPFDSPELVATLDQPGLICRAGQYDVMAIRWPVLDGMHGEGLLLQPHTGKGLAQIIAIPDPTQTAEQLAGLEEGLPPERQYARRLAESGCRVVIPTIIGRGMGPHKGRAHMTAREFVYRPAFELGRQLIGYEVQKVLALIDWLKKESEPKAELGVIGWGDGGMLALYSAALDSRIRATCVSGYFGDRSTLWRQPVDRNVFGLLDQFGDAEVASLIYPNTFIVEAAKAPEAHYSGEGGGAPSEVTTPKLDEVRTEFGRARNLCHSTGAGGPFQLVISGDGAGPSGSVAALETFLNALKTGVTLAPVDNQFSAPKRRSDAMERQARQMDEIDRFNQRLLLESQYVRAEFMKRLDTSSLENFARTAQRYRDFFAQEVIGRFDQPLLPLNPRSRPAYEADKWVGYEVVLDVFPDVIAYGLLLLPKDLEPGEKRPVVVCQHGLEGRPQDTIGKAGFQYYSAFSARLAEQGFITFAPQNLYIFHDRFRSLQRKANPLGKTLFSIMVPQHQQITEWLKRLPFVDPDRIALYGLSYGGKSAMRIPPLVTNYCLSICSGDFNDWVWKNASTLSPYSYAWMGEYEIFEFDLGSTFNYSEMAALIAPRPFMVERGHFDGVAPDETVAYEFAKVRHLYEAQLRLPPQDCEIEFFVGPHQVHGVGTFAFLKQHLHWHAP